MPKTLEELESLRDKLRYQLLEVGDFQPGTIYPRFRRCGKQNCVSAILYLQQPANHWLQLGVAFVSPAPKT